jgi:hypothetical protein
MEKKSTQWKRWLLPAGLLVLVSGLIFLPFAARLGFYRDDWYMLWSANVRGADSIIDLFSIDRPFMGYTYDLTYRLLGNSPIPWQIYSLVLKTLGAVAMYGIMRLIWPEQRRAAMAAALIYLVYPGFLGWPNAATKTNQLLSLTAELWSIWFSGLALQSERKTARVALIISAVLLALLNFLLYEYMIGLEVLRLWMLWLVPQQLAQLKTRDRIRRLIRDGWPYALAILGFLVWRLGFFQSGRGGTDQFAVVQSFTEKVRSTLVYVSKESIMDLLETFFVAWAFPFEKYAALEKSAQVGIAFFAAASVVVVVLVGMWLQKRYDVNDDEEAGRSRAVTVCLVGAVSLYAALFPVLLAGRDVDFTGGYDKYTLHASPAVAILIAGLIYGFIRGRGREITLGFLIFIGAASIVLNAYHWERFWENQKTLWWQLSWRAPGLKDGTTLLASIPEEGFFEDYELWGPANLIYRPGQAAITIGAEVLNPDTMRKIREGAVETRGMRKLDYVRDYNKSLLLALPSDHSCLKVVDNQDILLPLHYESSLLPILQFSHADQIDLTSGGSTPPEAIFGPEPVHDWCYYYQSAERAKQAGDWQKVAQLGDEATAAGLTPIDQAEWLPFLEGYLSTGNENRVADIKSRLDSHLVKEICDELARKQYRFGEVIQQELTQTLCP